MPPIDIILQLFVMILEVIIDGYIGYATDLEIGRRDWKILWITIIGIALSVGISYLTILMWPNHFITNKQLQVANLLISPIIAALFGGWLAYRREKRAKRIRQYCILYLQD